MKPSALRILCCLRDNKHRFVTAKELAELGSYDYRKRLSEIRRAGFVLERRHVPGRPYSSWRIVLEAQEGAGKCSG